MAIILKSHREIELIREAGAVVADVLSKLKEMAEPGISTGRLDEMLFKIGDIYEKKIRSFIKRGMSLMEPAVILTMGILVGFIVISMLMALFSMNEMPF